MSEIKPVYQRYCSDEKWLDINKARYDKEVEADCAATRILYPAAAYEALQKENAFVINDLHIARSHIGTLKTENAAQAKRIAGLEQSQLNEVINLRTRNAQLQAKMDQFAEVLRQHQKIDPFDLVNRLGEILVSASKNGD